MQPLARRSGAHIHAAIAGLVAAVYVADMVTPLGVAIWVFYLLPIALCVFQRARDLPIYVAVGASALIGLCAFTDSVGWSMSIALTNRLFGVAVVFAIAILVRQLIANRSAGERETWLRRAQTELFERLQGDISSEEVGERTLEVIAGATRARVGALYVASGPEAKLTASLALDRSAAAASYATGDGLIGQALRDRAPVVVSDLADDRWRIEGGVGSGSPRHLLIAPAWIDNRPMAVLALAGTSPFDDLARELATRIGEPLAFAVRTAEYRGRIEALLADTQRQAEQLQAQQEELRVINEELEEQGRALRESQARLEEQQAELEQANAHLESQTRDLEEQRAELESAKHAADRANSHKSEFLANMSHELRTPLNSALILARLLAENKPGNLTAEQVRHAETIYSAGNDLLLLINDVLDLAKIEAGRIDVHIDDTTPKRIVQQLHSTFAAVAAQRQLELKVAIADSAPASLATDEQRVLQVLKNLLSNALKFTERGHVALDVSGNDARVVFAVTDTGIGIPADKQAAIFDPFLQADGSTSRRFGGTGLGLSISRELTQLLGGDLTVTSEPGRGSTFTLTLPVRSTATTTVTHPAAAAAAARPRRATRPAPAAATAAFPDDRDHRRHPGRLVLVVDDDPRFAGILYQLAHELGFDCAVSHTAEDGIALARQLAPSGILLDIGLPDGSGLSVLERLKRDPATRHIPVHILSVADMAPTALELGAVGYAVKPVQREEVVDAIRRLEAKVTQQVRRILVVEDDERQRHSTCELLASDGVEIDAVASMAAGLERLAATSYDCMVLDLTLPDGSGYDMLEKMADSARYSFPPVIVYTGRELSRYDEDRLRKYSHSIIVKGARSPERLLDEVTLFLHQVESKLPADRQRILRQVRERDDAFEGRNILIVEDDVRNVFALTSLFEPRGAKVDIARNGIEALSRLDRGPTPDIVLMDIMMPEMDGLTATREIRKRPALRDLPIIALTAKAMRDDHERCLAAGASDYLPKPIEIDRLLSLCRVWLPRQA